MANTLRDDNHEIINALLEEYHADSETMLREVLENFMSSTQAFDFLAVYADQMGVYEDFPQFRDLDEDEGN